MSIKFQEIMMRSKGSEMGKMFFRVLDRFRLVRLNLEGKVQRNPTVTGGALPGHAGNILHLGEMHPLGIYPHMKYFLCSMLGVQCPLPKYASDLGWFSRATSIKEVTHATGMGANTIPLLNLLPAKSKDIGFHVLSGGSGTKVVSYAFRRNTIFNILNPSGIYIMADARQLGEDTKVAQQPSGESLIPECEYSMIRSIPPCIFLGYQKAIFGLTSFQDFVFNELYVDPNLYGKEYNSLFQAYHDKYQDMISVSWKTEGMPTYTGQGPLFTQEAFEAFIQLNLKFYTDVNQLADVGPRIVELDDEGKEMEVKPRYNIKNLEKALRKTFVPFVKSPFLEIENSSDEHKGATVPSTPK